MSRSFDVIKKALELAQFEVDVREAQAKALAELPPPLGLLGAFVIGRAAEIERDKMKVKSKCQK